MLTSFDSAPTESKVKEKEKGGVVDHTLVRGNSLSTANGSYSFMRDDLTGDGFNTETVVCVSVV